MGLYNQIKKILVGKPLDNSHLEEEKYGVLWGLPILSSDAISSVAYAGEEILMVLIPVVGLLSYRYMIYVSMAIVGLLFVVMLSYRQTIRAYPSGGGAYIVSKENLGVLAGATAGAALSIDYILTVAVSVSSGVEQLISAFPSLQTVKVALCVGIVLVITLGNLRGIRESSKLFGLPAYLFIFSMLLLIVTGFVRYFTGTAPTPVPAPAGYYGAGSVSLFLLLRAFSNGCTAMSGVEAVSNAVPNFKQPGVKNAQKVLLVLSGIVALLFLGTSVLANLYHVTPGEGQPTVLIQLADMVIGRGNLFTATLFYFITAMLFMILILASNTAFSGFPMLVSVMAREKYVPRQLSLRGDRLSYSNGILILSLISILLIVGFQADVAHLIGLYAVGVFISFTLSQTGMLMHWRRTREKGWKVKAVVNGFGAVITAMVIVIITVTKFTQGAWIVVILIPLLVFLMVRTKNHYTTLANQLRVEPERMAEAISTPYRNRVIVPISSINLTSIRALRYARTISDHVTAFSVVTDLDAKEKIRQDFEALHLDIPFVIHYSPYRKIVEPLLEYIESEEYNYQKGDIITVMLPMFVVRNPFHRLLHNQTKFFIERQLLRHKHIVVAEIPLQIKEK